MFAILLCTAAVAGLLLAEWRDSRRGVWIAKPTASLCFLFAAYEFGAMDSGYGLWILAGLGACALGDVLLIPRQRPRAFQAGIASFLLGHVAYAFGFLWLGVDHAALALAAVAMTGFAFGALRWLTPHLSGDFRTPVRVYVGVISAMVACSIGVVAAGGPASAAIGAIAFAASDLAVARDRFITPGFANGAWGLPLYYAAQLTLAGSAA